jgi:hypothetical protein
LGTLGVKKEKVYLLPTIGIFASEKSGLSWAKSGRKDDFPQFREDFLSEYKQSCFLTSTTSLSLLRSLTNYPFLFSGPFGSKVEHDYTER